MRSYRARRKKNVRAVRKERLHHPSVLGLTGEDAKTIDAEIEIDADYVICDESSMIDAPLFLQLVSAVARSGASLLLVGDANQLPPVGVGLPFKDLLNSEKSLLPYLRDYTDRQVKVRSIPTP